jgi:hypothetical protein
MNDTRSDVRAVEQNVTRVEEAATKLAFELRRVKNGVFGVPQLAIDIANEELELAGLDVRLTKTE